MDQTNLETMRYNRRSFINTSFKGTLAVSLGLTTIGSMLQSCGVSKSVAAAKSLHTSFDQSPLPYAYNAIENVIDRLTMEIHYTKHAAGYSKSLKEAVREELAQYTITEDILANISRFSSKMRNNAGGHFNHEMFWKSIRAPRNDNEATGTIAAAIISTFGSMGSFKQQFNDAASTRFGSGWAWLYMDNGVLKIGSTPNQDNPLMNNANIKGFPILGLDVWEHAYYLQYQNKRADYIANFWKIVNWDYVQQRYDAAKL